MLLTGLLVPTECFGIHLGDPEAANVGHAEKVCPVETISEWTGSEER